MMNDKYYSRHHDMMNDKYYSRQDDMMHDKYYVTIGPLFMK